MSQVRANAFQVGTDSVTAANNFSLNTPTVPNGVLTLTRGNVGSPLSTVFSVDASNNITFGGTVYGLVPTGAFQHFMLPAAPAGWIAGDGSTIGNTGSGATVTGATVQALFTAWWAYTDVQLPILTSAAIASSRGASAAADWAALKRLTVFDVRDRVPRSSGTTQVNGTKLEPTEIMVPYGVSGATGVMTSNQVDAVFNNDASNAAHTVTYSTWGMSGPAAATALSYYKMRVASIGMLGCFKL